MAYKYVRIAGNRRQVGVALGKLARPIMAAYLDQSGAWEALRPWRGHPYVDELAQQAQAALPQVWEELEGMAEGLRMPVKDVLLWHCRGDLLHSTTDGCTSVALKAADGSRWIGHNEDGDPYLHGRCHLVDVALEGAPGYLSFYYPGSLPGHTFGANRAGLVQTINNLRTRQRHPGVPRMLLARAVLDCATLDEALDLLRGLPHSGGFHHTLAAATDPRIVSAEVTPGSVSFLEIGRRYGHANHMVHVETRGQPQIITDSSRARQNRIEGLVDGWSADSGSADMLAALLDTEGALPILRTARDDPDDENTLATAIFEIRDGEVVLRVYDRKTRADIALDVMSDPG
ncbi:C45 family autoproteolytic acyltransferase/hydolase [Achromobacter arsenitoxydans]|uniref:Acyl-coenzyme A:6-aminopenicillanic acid acyl-transferase family protein 3 n=1 Tax=Achromobacter arsenitoxydans SY8 TaxID=477184 RepID=H0F3S1_9BURK|nr:C45 family peptidase [Achromobacter arsenitoxydans]EHK67126.1 acyl-coenzyme A:6-aminopenicillanic acid acyl-transferase family protein 3 [Achromobacter arsenitoxydans SY8]